MSEDIIDQLLAMRCVDGSTCMVELPETVVGNAIIEINRLRDALAGIKRVAGAVSVEGHSYADIRANAKHAGTAGPGEPS